MHFAFSLDRFQGSFALLSDHTDTDRAVVFVHGFCGGAASTWLDFQGLVDSDLPGVQPWWQCADMYFYTYHSVDAMLEFNAQDFKTFLAGIFPNVQTDAFLRAQSNSIGLYNIHPFPTSTRTYDKLILIGHSEGAVVIRKTIANLARLLESNEDCREINCTQVLKASVNLFSPAILGFSPSGSNALLLELDIPGLRRTLRAHNELQPDSPLLIDLKSETILYAERHPHLHALRARIGFGKDERVVFVGNYRTDPEVMQLCGTHTSVCKPISNFLEPFRFIADALPSTKSTTASQS